MGAIYIYYCSKEPEIPESEESLQVKIPYPLNEIEAKRLIKLIRGCEPLDFILETEYIEKRRYIKKRKSKKKRKKNDNRK